MLKIAICDDEMEFTTRLETIVSKTAWENDIQIEVNVFFDGRSLLNMIQNNHVRYDLIFLDIEMGDFNGIETARKIRERDELVYLIYVTVHRSYAIEAYEVHPFQFVPKPIEDECIKKYFLMVYEKISSGDFYYEFKFQKEYYKVFVNDIMYFESDKRKINIHLADGTMNTYHDKLDIIEEWFKFRKADFLRIHRSLLVNVRYIKKKAYDSVELFDGTLLWISESRRKKISEQYAEWIGRDMDL